MKVLFINYTDPLELGRAHLMYLRYMGLLVPCPSALDTFEQVAVHCALPNETSVTVQARVVNSFGLNVFGLQVLSDSRASRLLEVSRDCAGILQKRMLGSGGSEEVKLGPLVCPGGEDEDTVPDAMGFINELTPVQQVIADSEGRFQRWLVEQEAETGPEFQVSASLETEDARLTRVLAPEPDRVVSTGEGPEPIEMERQLWSLPLVEKKQLAVSAGPIERDILFRDQDLSVQVWVLKNPDVGEWEVAAYARVTPLAPDALQMMLTTRRWSLSRVVARTLAVNPSVPAKAVERLLSILSTTELRELGWSAGVNDLVGQLARETISLRGDG